MLSLALVVVRLMEGRIVRGDKDVGVLEDGAKLASHKRRLRVGAHLID